MIKSHVISLVVFVCLCMCQKSMSQEHGIASYYADYFNGRKMANGECYDPNLYTCAHPTAPIGTIIKVARKDNPDKSVIVTVTDRGPFIKGRIIDLSKQAASDLGILHIGIAEVVVALIRKPAASKEGYYVMSDAQD